MITMVLLFVLTMLAIACLPERGARFISSVFGVGIALSVWAFIGLFVWAILPI